MVSEEGGSVLVRQVSGFRNVSHAHMKTPTHPLTQCHPLPNKVAGTQEEKGLPKATQQDHQGRAYTLPPDCGPGIP